MEPDDLEEFREILRELSQDLPEELLGVDHAARGELDAILNDPALFARRMTEFVAPVDSSVLSGTVPSSPDVPWSDAERLEAIDQALADPSFVDVVRALDDDPEWPGDEDDILVSFDDSTAHVLSDLIDVFVAALPGLDGGGPAWREDRELVIVQGGDARRLAARTRRWWKDRLAAERKNAQGKP